MASKVLRGDETAVAESLSWSEAGIKAKPNPAGGRGPAADSGVAAQLQEQIQILQAEMPRRVADAQEAGRRQGEAAGRQAAQAQVKTATDQLAAAIASLAEYRPALRAQAEQDVVKLALAIARRVLNRELAADSEALCGVIRVGMDKLRHQENVRVRVHSEFAAPVRDYLARTGASRIEVVADAGQARGAVIFETSRGALDLSTDTQMDEIERGLTDRVRAK
jgi:flagellar assembly protein FliH